MTIVLSDSEDGKNMGVKCDSVPPFSSDGKNVTLAQKVAAQLLGALMKDGKVKGDGKTQHRPRRF